MQYKVTVFWNISGEESVTMFFVFPSTVANFVREACFWQGMTSITVTKVRA